MKLDGALATIEPRRRAAALRRRGAAAAGRRARRAGRAHRARVRREHPGHGRRSGEDERERLRRRPLARARVGGGGRAPRRGPARARPSSGSPTAARTSALPRWSRGRPSRSRRRRPESVKATLAEMRAARREAQPSGIKTFGSTFKNPDDARAEGRSAGVLLDEAGCRGLAVGGARFSEKHANFVENTGDGDHRRRGRAHGRGTPARARALRRDARAGGPVPRRRGRRGCCGRHPREPAATTGGVGRVPRCAVAAPRGGRRVVAALARALPRPGPRARRRCSAPGGRARAGGRLPALDPGLRRS